MPQSGRRNKKRTHRQVAGLPMNQDRCVTFTNGVTIQYAPPEVVDALLEKYRDEAKADRATRCKSTTQEVH